MTDEPEVTERSFKLYHDHDGREAFYINGSLAVVDGEVADGDGQFVEELILKYFGVEVIEDATSSFLVGGGNAASSVAAIQAYQAGAAAVMARAQEIEAQIAALVAEKEQLTVQTGEA